MNTLIHLLFNDYRNFKEKCSKKKDSGQVLIEFILLFVIITGLSILLVKGVGGHIADRWQAAITVITKPTDTNIQLR